jgi:hypothetical protein
MKAAKQSNLAVSPMLFALADEVVEYQRADFVFLALFGSPTTSAFAPLFGGQADIDSRG